MWDTQYIISGEALQAIQAALTSGERITLLVKDSISERAAQIALDSIDDARKAITETRKVTQA